jgi:peptidoglycan hydrolase-like protein with peptidoglycan-binding domain
MDRVFLTPPPAEDVAVGTHALPLSYVEIRGRLRSRSMRRKLTVFLAWCALVIGLVAGGATTAHAAGTAGTAAAGDDVVQAFGDASFSGSTSALGLNAPLVGFAPTPTGRGYWLLARDGGVFSFGDATFQGSTGGLRLNRPVVGIAATRTGNGYWLVAEDGGIFAFGDARFLGSTGGMRLSRPIVAMTATPTGNGYWLLAADGGVFTFGDAAFQGSTGGTPLAKPAVGIARTPTGNGYWIAAGDGAVYAYGDATSFGNAPGHEAITAIASAPDGQGYWLAGQDGGVYTAGNATFAGSANGAVRPTDVTFAIAPTPTGKGYWVAAGPSAAITAGASGSPVLSLQSRLDALGYWVPVDGTFGATTTQALYALQKAAGIPRTGTFDNATQSALRNGIQPTPRGTDGYGVEVDKARRLLLLVSNGRVVRTFNTSTGNEARYRSGNGWAVAHTPEGQFRVYTQVNGLRISDLGELWRPKFFTGGYAMHGSPNIPPYPASHGCLRLSNAAINWLWDTNAVPVGTPVYVYS